MALRTVRMLSLTSSAVAIMSLSNPAAAQPITITVSEWCPYMCTTGERAGAVVEMTEAALATQGVDVAFEAYPWVRAIDVTRAGETAAALAPARGETPDFVFPDVPISHQQMCFFTRADSDWEYVDVESLEGVSFGVMEGLSLPGLEDYVEANLRTPAIQEISGERFMEQNLHKLHAGRIDAVIDDRAVVLYYLQQHEWNSEDFRVAGCLAAEPIYLGISPAPELAESSAALSEAFTAGLRTIVENGEAAAILDDYGTPDSMPNLD